MDCLPFLLEDELGVVDANELKSIVNCLPEDCRLNYVLANIGNVSTLVYALSLLPHQQAKIDLISRYQHLVSTAIDVYIVIKSLPAELCLAFATANQDKISGDFDMSLVLKYLPEASRLAFRKANVGNAAMLISLLDDLPQDERLAATIEYQHVINNYKKLGYVLRSLQRISGLSVLLLICIYAGARLVE